MRNCFSMLKKLTSAGRICNISGSKSAPNVREGDGAITVCIDRYRKKLSNTTKIIYY
jgi:hypothetical protein